MVLRNVIGYLTISIVIMVIYYLSSLVYKYFLRKIDKDKSKYLRFEFILAFFSLGIVLLLNLYDTDIFLFYHKEEALSKIIFIMIGGSLPVALLISSSSPEKKEKMPLGMNVLTGMLMEVPQRLLVQNLFILFGATSIIFGSINLAIILTALIWVQFIILQQVLQGKVLNKSLIVDIIASAWFSVWVGTLYILTGNLIIVMFTHGLERAMVYGLRRSRLKSFIRV